MHAARAVALLEGGQDPEPHAAAECFRGARERRGLAEEDAFLADPRNVGGPGRNQGCRREHQDHARTARSGPSIRTMNDACGHDPSFLVKVRRFCPLS